MRLSFGFLSVFALAACGGSAGSEVAGNTIARYTVEIVNTYPHDRGAFTQGLLIDEGVLFESTGKVGQSTIRHVDLETGTVTKQISLPGRYFGEGIAEINDKLYALTWTSGDGFIFDKETLRRTGSFTFNGEGWGMTSDGQQLIMSNGTDEIRFVNPDGFETKRTIKVKRGGVAVERLNELEWIEGEIWANIWQSDEIVQIDPGSGRVTGVIDASSLSPSGPRDPLNDNVLNGIAWNPDTEQIYLTGKRWPNLFEVRLVEAKANGE